jgi:hypothetical protein
LFGLFGKLFGHFSRKVPIRYRYKITERRQIMVNDGKEENMKDNATKEEILGIELAIGYRAGGGKVYYFADERYLTDVYRCDLIAEPREGSKNQFRVYNVYLPEGAVIKRFDSNRQQEHQWLVVKYTGTGADRHIFFKNIKKNEVETYRKVRRDKLAARKAKNEELKTALAANPAQGKTKPVKKLKVIPETQPSETQKKMFEKFRDESEKYNAEIAEYEAWLGNPIWTYDRPESQQGGNMERIRIKHIWRGDKDDETNGTYRTYYITADGFLHYFSQIAYDYWDNIRYSSSPAPAHVIAEAKKIKEKNELEKLAREKERAEQI